MMRTELLFPTPLWIFEDLPIDRQKIVDFCYDVEKDDPVGAKKSNAGGWQSLDFRPEQMDQLPLAELHQHILSNAYSAGDDYGFTQYSLQLSNCWMNINRKGNYNQLHTHSGSMFAGVYYANVPNCCMGELRFLRDLKDQCLKEYWGCDENFDRHEKQHNYTEWYVQPQNNLMVIFPAWLMHSVDMSASDDDRISLSFNLHIFSDYYRDNAVYPKRKSNNSKLSLQIK